MANLENIRIFAIGKGLIPIICALYLLAELILEILNETISTVLIYFKTLRLGVIIMLCTEVDKPYWHQLLIIN